MHGVEGGHEVVPIRLELETLSGRVLRLEFIDPVGSEQSVDLFQHRWAGIDACEREIRDRLEHREDIAPGAAADIGTLQPDPTIELSCNMLHRFAVGRANGPVD